MSEQIEFLILLTVVIVIHEAGHYTFARLFGVRVNRASLFFNPFFTLLKYNPLTGRLDFISKKRYITLTSKDGLREATGELSSCQLSIQITQPKVAVAAWDEEAEEFREVKTVETNVMIMGDPEPAPQSEWRYTQYCIGWLPFGGYVTLQSDASDAGILSKKNSQQFLISFAGILFNIITMLLALVVMRLCISYSYGSEALLSWLWGFAGITFSLIVLNILPLPGLDGGGMLMCVLNYILPRNARIIMTIINNLLGIVVFVWIISTWFRSSFGFEQRFWEFASNCFYIIAYSIIY